MKFTSPRKKFLALAICASATLGGCASQFDPGTTLADLPAATLPPEPQVELPQVELPVLIASYEKALAANSNPRTRRQIQLRLADLEMERLEQLQADNPEMAVAYSEAVRHYEALLQTSADDDYLAYRLARARALDGNLPGSLQALENIVETAPESPFIAEALFRRGEAAFSQKRYRAAERDFAAVLAQGESPFARNARYMLGWSQFKDARYRDAGNTFLTLMDLLLAEKEPEKRPLDQLQKGERRLADDTLRVLALGFNYLGGAEVIESFNTGSEAGIDTGRSYQHLLYRALGDWYAESERYRDGAQTFLTYVERNPQSRQAPGMHVRAVEILQQGNFPSEVVPAKREFVTRYGIRSQYWQSADDAQRGELRSRLKPWLEELARFDHARAQALAKEASSPKNSAKAAAHARRESRSAFLAAAGLYGEFIQTFPGDDKEPPLTFLMAESLNDAGEYARAFDAYSRVAWGFTEETRHTQANATEAGYAAILMAGQMHKLEKDPELANLWLDRKTETSLHFAETWPTDKRALPVQLDAAHNLFEQYRHAETIAAAEKAAGWQPPPDARQRRSILILLGHSHFETENFPAAENAYAQLLAGMASSDQEYLNTRDRLQSSIYKQAEVILKQVHLTTDSMEFVAPTEEAIALLLRVRESGRSAIAATAQFDAINQLMRLKRWPQAQAELADFRKFYPDHQLTPSLTAKAVAIYQGLDMPEAAASELMALANSDPDPRVRRDSLYLAAEQFETSGNTQRAIDAYRQYARQWREPALQNLEAQYQLVSLYEKSGNARERNLWINSLAGNRVAEPRGRYLAAYARNELAEQSFARFERQKLTLPLKQSLKNKKQAMEATVSDYKKVLDLGIAEFTTAANFRLAEIYRQLSRDLMDSQRPNGLSPLELEQYEILLEEQAYPFEEKAIELHEANIKRTADGIYDDWVKHSFSSLENLLPARYRKPESTVEWSDAAY
ncbi:tetratricopeptide repeat protein [Microbulbifer hydrolyticus]|uniref:Tetratricopeptide repeat protein n=1 Tax=Microbulbifer hydrolyticus TaxID=48074 RepID=A0A6P1T6T1_9GAMM|nr:tetratricopeptide repeat protein [Microbulbifer hydrolyticus]MBB5211532.1 TolA-binding protein [Microbulbifer hydrolyticus]QHQ37727.1 tetratricopeptide repeat protein [Microbulbifer hydrolyticus]